MRRDFTRERTEMGVCHTEAKYRLENVFSREIRGYGAFSNQEV